MRTDMNGIVPINSILPSVKAAYIKQLYQEISIHAGQELLLEPHMLYAQLMDAEQKHSSGIGGNVAIPHLKIEGLKEPYILFAGLKRSIDFDAIDKKDVDLIFMLLSPADNVAAHLYTLSRLTRMVKDQELCTKLRGVSDSETIKAIFAAQSIQQMAA